MIKLTVFGFLTVILLVSFTSALSVNSVFVDTASPGEEGIIKIDLENDGNRDVDLVSLTLDFPDSGIIPIGSSEGFVNEIKEDDEETFAFRFRIANDLHAGTYSLPYKITYEENNDKREQSGTIGIVVSAEPELEVAADTKNAIVGQQGELNLRIINKGLADSRFVYLFLESDDLTFLSEKSEYIGTIDSDDFETSSFDVIYNEKFTSLSARIIYKDFNNKEVEINKIISLRAYTVEEAVEKGILKKSNLPIYVGIVILLLVSWIIYRTIRKRRKAKE